jgi:predicted 3-demethylubiquinone-9 3-methyltransferase (glyoxalase superfamily)
MRWPPPLGQEQPCGCLVDKFGLSWQIVPNALVDIRSDADPVKAKCVIEAMFQMTKIDLPAIEQAYDQADTLPS